MSSYYNEWDPYCAQWLRNLIAAGHIPAGDVDERSIVDVRPDDLRGYSQCHFFSGIAGWPLALKLAGWPDDREVWTGSCPCQPLSCAGQRKGDVDKRHLWPPFYRLISERRPATVFGEQVSGKDGIEWLSAVRADLEGIGYAVGAADLPACGVGAPHIRRRLFWVAHHSRTRLEERKEQSAWQERAAIERGGDAGDSARYRERQPRFDQEGGGREGAIGGSSPWRDLEWLPCIDGKWRPTKPGLQPLAYGIPARVGKLRAAGNAIVPQVAAEFVKAAMECTP